MRQAQSNRRGRGRSRKAQNPLTRNYESNGPDVKIRGTAAHISEKYNSLARDALASSDIVRHENYLQHAEHYNRIIMAAQQNEQGANNAAQARDGDNNNEKAKAGADGETGGDSQKKHRSDNRKNVRRRRNEGKNQRVNDSTAEQGDGETIAVQSQAEDVGAVENGIASEGKEADDAAA